MYHSINWDVTILLPLNFIFSLKIKLTNSQTTLDTTPAYSIPSPMLLQLSSSFAKSPLLEVWSCSLGFSSCDPQSQSVLIGKTNHLLILLFRGVRHGMDRECTCEVERHEKHHASWKD